MQLNQPELTQQALDILRNPKTFEWYFIPLLAFAVYIYFNEYSKKNWRWLKLSSLSVHVTAAIIIGAAGMHTSRDSCGATSV